MLCWLLCRIQTAPFVRPARYAGRGFRASWTKPSKTPSSLPRKSPASPTWIRMTRSVSSKAAALRYEQLWLQFYPGFDRLIIMILSYHLLCIMIGWQSYFFPKSKSVFKGCEKFQLLIINVMLKLPIWCPMFVEHFLNAMGFPLPLMYIVNIFIIYIQLQILPITPD